MWPIILCSITAAAIILERLWTLQDKRVLPRELPQKVWQLIEANQVNDKVIAALEQNSPLGRLLATGLANRHRPREILMERLEDTGRHVVYELERFLNTLGTIAGVAAARPARYGHRHHPRLQRHRGRRHGRPARALGWHRRSPHRHRGGPVRRHPLAHRLSLPAWPGRRTGGGDGEARDSHGRCPRVGAAARTARVRGRRLKAEG